MWALQVCHRYNNKDVGPTCLSQIQQQGCGPYVSVTDTTTRMWTLRICHRYNNKDVGPTCLSKIQKLSYLFK
ncbi:hypothetical protein Bpfe_011460, partial [Biomphalaria pfeifferi]